jgi:hypothetical protein
MSYLGLTGLSTSCTEFYGITEVPWKHLTGKDEDGVCLCFVFEQATEGHLMKRMLRDVEKGDWQQIADFLGGVLGGLDSLHKRNIIHG